MKHTMKRTQIKPNQIGTLKVNKICLSCFDDKLLKVDGGIKTLWELC